MDDLCCPPLPSFDVTPDMESPQGHLLFQYNVDLDESWCKIVQNYCTVIAVVERNHAKFKFGTFSTKKKLSDECVSELKTFSQPKKGILVVGNFTSGTISKALKEFAQFLHLNELGVGIPCWLMDEWSLDPCFVKYQSSDVLYKLLC